MVGGRVPHLHQLGQLSGLSLPPVVVAVALLHHLQVEQHHLLPGLQLTQRILHFGFDSSALFLQRLQLGSGIEP